MTAALAIRSVLELTAILLILYGVAKEEKLIAFEQKIWRILFVNYRRYKRKKYNMPLQKKQKLTLYKNTGAKAAHAGSGSVA